MSLPGHSHRPGLPDFRGPHHPDGVRHKDPRRTAAPGQRPRPVGGGEEPQGWLPQQHR